MFVYLFACYRVIVSFYNDFNWFVIQLKIFLTYNAVVFHYCLLDLHSDEIFPNL